MEISMKSPLAILLCFSLSLHMGVEGAPNGTESREEETWRLQQPGPEVEQPVTVESLKEQLKTAIETMQSTMAIAGDCVNRLGEERNKMREKYSYIGILYLFYLHQEILTNRHLMKELLNVSQMVCHFVPAPDLSPTPLPAKPCNDPPPGLSKMIRGVDVTKLDLFPLDFSKDDGFRKPIVDFTCDKGATVSINEKNYDIPEQVSSVTRIPGGSVLSGVQIFKSHRDVKRSMAVEAGAELTLETFGFSSSSSYQHMQNTIMNTSRYIEEVSSFDSAVQADLSLEEELNLGKSAKSFVDKLLPANFTDDPGPYEKFIATFGTHYFQNGKFGGVIKLIMETKSEYFDQKTDEQIKAEAQTSYSDLTIKIGYKDSIVKIDKKFEEMTTKHARYYGGNTNLLASDGMQIWQPTVLSDPWLFSGKLSPISNLIREERKRTSMEQAVTNHVLHAYLGELARIVQAINLGCNSRKKCVGIFGTLTIFDILTRDSLETLTARITALQGQRLLDKTEVEGLGKEVETIRAYEGILSHRLDEDPYLLLTSRTFPRPKIAFGIENLPRDIEYEGKIRRK
ncbi:unnamed protein product [Darwinula stevensoni]|uniref:MACPF domain-containing protein n=1 Tax=Darwinula stevensoni TaxID=69355 RepID=A0A7R8X2N2_9CRUS|nr:unnamed protein product [Darwinula stevensoni]CAG0884115.1 unnamed protein product [Darwinula stevensoni]